jgi:2-dehydro-3-deoxyphosphooctonate aldolase (KDO 8-P synthase)
MQSVRIGEAERSTTVTGEGPLTVIGGPCTAESFELCLEVGRRLSSAAREAGCGFVFKASFDKANRSSVSSPRGPGLERGCDWIVRVGRELGVPTTSDVHEPRQAAAVAEAGVDLLQIPAFLCRQTDLLTAAAATGRSVNVKKGQFVAPSEMGQAVRKLTEAGAGRDGRGILLTERGTFFGYHRLVNDFAGLGDLMELGPPVCFDLTHSTQLPGASATSGGRPERAPLLGRAAVAAGCPAVFLEAHPEPSKALSDGASMLDLESAARLIGELAAFRATYLKTRGEVAAEA